MRAYLGAQRDAGEGDDGPDPEDAAAVCPKALLEIPDAGHYDIYEPPYLATVPQAQIGWFRQHLA